MKSTEETRRILKELLAEALREELPTGIPRDFDFQLPQMSRLLTIVGSRRAGKTYLSYQILHFWRSKGIPRKRLVHLNFEDERLYPLSGQELTLLLDVYDELEEWDGKEPLCLALDEIQNIPYWSKWARRIVEKHPQIRLILTGSSSKLLSAELATELRGRALSAKVFPYSFRERVIAEGWDPKTAKTDLYGRAQNRWLRLFNTYLHKGGYPDACREPDPTVLLQGYYQTMFMRDMVERYRIKQVGLFEEFLKITITRFSSLFSVSSLHGALETRHGRLSKATLIQYMRYAREVFLLFEMPRYDTKVRQQMVYPRKLYAVDTGLLEAIRFSTTEDYGRLLENAVYLELVRRGGALFYHRQDKECDFVVQDKGRVRQAIQVAWSIDNKETRERELNGLLEAMRRFGLKEGLILTSREHETLKVDKRLIHVLPFWYWALNPEINGTL